MLKPRVLVWALAACAAVVELFGATLFPGAIREWVSLVLLLDALLMLGVTLL